tara:strand:+ start:10224 stop:10784 length:561 start_codon:yes stop_codon:yes gene_type:complete
MSGLIILLILIIIAIIALVVVYFVYRNKSTALFPDLDRDRKQVFNISDNIFTYDDARAVCKANNSELATLEQMIDAYEKGADWCNYGWCANQVALYPTQLETWKKNQDNHLRDSCGKPGVNGGYFNNPNTFFGANCYGVKPRATVKNLPNPPYQDLTDEQLKVAIYKDKHYNISPFNKEKWSKYDK